MLLHRMTYNLDKMQRDPKHKKLLGHILGPGLAVGAAISMWSMIIVTIFLLVIRNHEVPSMIGKTALIIELVFVLLGFVIGGILENKLRHNKLRKGVNKLSDKEIRKLNVFFVILPFIIAFVAIFGLIAVVIVSLIIQKIKGI